MDAISWTTVLSPFYKLAGEINEELIRNEISKIGLEDLNFKRQALKENLEDTKKKLAKEAERKKREKLADLNSRGLSNSTLLSAFELAIDRDLSEELGRIDREVRRTIVRIALKEREVQARGRSLWQRLFSRN